MKYIDAEKLKSIIKAQIKERKEWMKDTNRSDRQDQLWSDLNGEDMSILQIIDSLQQKQDLIVINKKDWEAQEQFQKNQDFGKPLQQEQSETDLNADIEMEWDSFNKHLNEYGEESEDVVWLNWNSFADVARNFYELGLKAK